MIPGTAVQQSGKALLCNGYARFHRTERSLIAYGYTFPILGSLYFREHRGDSAQTEDIVCGIRSTYGGGACATEGDVWGACWG